MLIYVNITDRQTHQKYSSEPHKMWNRFMFKSILKKNET